MNKNTIINHLKAIKSTYAKEGFEIKGLFGSYSRDTATETSDIDVLIEATPLFANTYGFKAFARIKEIQQELSLALGKPVEFADITGMGKTAKKFIIDKTIYV